MAYLTETIEFKPQYPLPLVEQVNNYLTESIIEGRLVVGQRLIEHELKRKFKVSRTPIRESFRTLEQKGLLVTIPRKGTFVREITQRDIEENFPIRAYLEGFAARLAVQNLKYEDIEAMQSVLAMMTEAGMKAHIRAYLEYHLKFHEIFIDASQNNTLIAILKNLRRKAIWFRFSFMGYKEFSDDFPVQVHEEILNLFVKKDSDKVEALVKDHIMVALKRFQCLFTTKKE